MWNHDSKPFLIIFLSLHECGLSFVIGEAIRKYLLLLFTLHAVWLHFMWSLEQSWYWRDVGDDVMTPITAISPITESYNKRSSATTSNGQKAKLGTWSHKPHKKTHLVLCKILQTNLLWSAPNRTFFAERQSVLILQICRRDFSELSDNFTSIFSLSFSRTGSCNRRRQSQQMSLVVTESWSKECSKCIPLAPLVPFQNSVQSGDWLSQGPETLRRL